MGATTSCPAGFEKGTTWNTCHKECPDDFRYMEENGNGKCVYRYDNSKTVTANLLSAPEDPAILDSSYEREQIEFSMNLENVREQIRVEEQITQAASSAKAQKTNWTNEYSRIKSETASYNAAVDVKKVLDDTNQSLRPLRASVAPSDDLEKERRAITIDARQNMALAQFALFLVVLSLIAYITLSREMAHGITFLLLCVGIATGFFLRR